MDCGAETATLTATVPEAWCAAPTTATSCSPAPPPPRTAVWPSVRDSPARAAAARMRSPAIKTTEIVTGTLSVPAVSNVDQARGQLIYLGNRLD